VATRHIPRSFVICEAQWGVTYQLNFVYILLILIFFFIQYFYYFCRLQSYSTRPTTYTSWNRRRRDFCRKTVSWSGWWASKRASCWARPACTRNAKSTTPPVSTRLGVWNVGGRGVEVGRLWLVVCWWGGWRGGSPPPRCKVAAPAGYYVYIFFTFFSFPPPSRLNCV